MKSGGKIEHVPGGWAWAYAQSTSSPLFSHPVGHQALPSSQFLSPSRGLDTNIAEDGGGRSRSGTHTHHNSSRQRTVAAIPSLDWQHHSMLSGQLIKTASLLPTCNLGSWHVPVLAISLGIRHLLWVEAVGPWEGETPGSTYLPLARGSVLQMAKGDPSSPQAMCTQSQEGRGPGTCEGLHWSPWGILC